ncbi:hypothetical protein [Mycolicibacterium phlei]
MLPIVRRLEAPTRVAVRGRTGVGRATVAAALAAAGVTVATAGDVDVLVLTEAPKPEDLALVDPARRPVVAVLNKADCSGLGAGGPLAVAYRRAARFRSATGLVTVPMIALLADLRLPESLLAALQTLVAEPADLTSADAFVGGAHPLPAEVRARLLAVLDRFGIAHAVLALSEGVRPEELPARLRRLSQLDRVLEAVQAAAAPLRYRRLRAAIAELQALATQSEDLADLLAADDAVLSAMTAAVDVVEAAGLHVDRGDNPAAHLRRAVHWRRYGHGPVAALHRACAADITRGSLRLLERTR